MNVVTRSLELQAQLQRRIQVAAEQAGGRVEPRSKGEAAAAGVVGGLLALSLAGCAVRGAVRRLLEARRAGDARRRKEALRRFFSFHDGDEDGNEDEGGGDGRGRAGEGEGSGGGRWRLEVGRAAGGGGGGAVRGAN